jgi:hypothetical protein
MKRTILVTTAAALLLMAASVLGQSLADLAKKEKERRAAIKGQAKVINNSNKDEHTTGPVTTFSSAPAKPAEEAQPAKEGVEAEKEPAAAAETDEPVDFAGRPESFWRQTMRDARQKVATLEDEARVLTLKLADLQNTFYSEASGYRQQDIQREIQKTYYEQDLNKKNLEEARKSLADLQNEARKDGALPGWLDPKIP